MVMSLRETGMIAVGLNPKLKIQRFILALVYLKYLILIPGEILVPNFQDSNVVRMIRIRLRARG